MNTKRRHTMTRASAERIYQQMMKIVATDGVPNLAAFQEALNIEGFSPRYTALHFGDVCRELNREERAHLCVMMAPHLMRQLCTMCDATRDMTGALITLGVIACPEEDES